MANTTRKKIRPQAYGTFALAALVLVAVIFIFTTRSKSSAAFAAGRDYLKTQEEQNAQDIQNRLMEIDKAIDPEVIQNTDTVFSAYANSVIMGDSRAKGFMEYGYLPESKVLAEIGDSISAISRYTDQLAEQKPSYIFFTYGLNNMNPSLENGYDQSVIDEYERLIQQASEASPYSSIVVCAMLPVNEAAKASHPEYAGIEKFNEDMKKVAEKNGWIYADDSSLKLDEDQSWFEPDGEHFITSFYPLWAQNMMQEAYQATSVNKNAGSSSVNQSAKDDSSKDDSETKDPAKDDPQQADQNAASGSQSSDHSSGFAADSPASSADSARSNTQPSASEPVRNTDQPAENPQTDLQEDLSSGTLDASEEGLLDPEILNTGEPLDQVILDEDLAGADLITESGNPYE